MPLPIALFVLVCFGVMFAFGLVFLGRAMFDGSVTRVMGPAVERAPAKPTDTPSDAVRSNGDRPLPL